MLPYFEDGFGNSASIHEWGRRAHAAVDVARSRVATLIGAEDPSQVIFTSGATESNNWVLRSYQNGWVSPFEHASVREPARHLGMNLLPNAELILGKPSFLASLVSVMSVNNEIGSRWDVREFRGCALRLHADITQQAGKLPTSVEGLDFASLSSHKFYGPKGVGALYMANDLPQQLMLGGEQEFGARAGTLNVPGIVGMGAAAAVAIDEMEHDRDHAVMLRQTFLQELTGLSDWQMNGGEDVSPYILSLSFRGVEGEALVVELDQAGYAISSGAACSASNTEPSHVLRALSIPPEWARGTIRISFGRSNSALSVASLAKSVRLFVEKLRTMTS